MTQYVPIFSYVWRVAYCDPRRGVAGAIEMVQTEQVDVLMGPGCSSGMFHKADIRYGLLQIAFSILWEYRLCCQ